MSMRVSAVATTPALASAPAPAPASADRKIAPPCAMVIFGASGDLTRRKLVPALYNLAHGGLLPEGFVAVGLARKPWTDSSFRDEMSRGVAEFSRLAPLDRSLWGSDQAASVEIVGLVRLVRDIRGIEESLGDGVKVVYQSELAALKRLRRVPAAPPSPAASAGA